MVSDMYGCIQTIRWAHFALEYESSTNERNFTPLTLMSLECGDKLKPLVLQFQNVDLSAVVSHKHVATDVVVRYVHAPRLCLETAQLSTRFRAAPLKGFIARDAEYPVHLRDKLQCCYPVTVCCRSGERVREMGRGERKRKREGGRKERGDKKVRGEE